MDEVPKEIQDLADALGVPVENLTMALPPDDLSGFECLRRMLIEDDPATFAELGKQADARKVKHDLHLKAAGIGLPVDYFTPFRVPKTPEARKRDFFLLLYGDGPHPLRERRGTPIVETLLDLLDSVPDLLSELRIERIRKSSGVLSWLIDRLKREGQKGQLATVLLLGIESSISNLRRDLWPQVSRGLPPSIQKVADAIIDGKPVEAAMVREAVSSLETSPDLNVKERKVLNLLRKAYPSFVKEAQIQKAHGARTAGRRIIDEMKKKGAPIESVDDARARGADVPEDAVGYRLTRP